ncbi:hypothetical protein DMENIID0001_041980 [Sergentomyia squamirostris]
MKMHQMSQRFEGVKYLKHTFSFLWKFRDLFLSEYLPTKEDASDLGKKCFQFCVEYDDVTTCKDLCMDILGINDRGYTCCESDPTFLRHHDDHGPDFDHLYGLNYCFARTHELFTPGQLYAANGVLLPEVEGTKHKNFQIVWKGHLDGIEGLRQKGWTIFTDYLLREIADLRPQAKGGNSKL